MLIIDGATSSVLITSLEVEISFVLKPLLIKIFIADSILLARSTLSRDYSKAIAREAIIAIGLAMPLPAMSGALP